MKQHQTHTKSYTLQSKDQTKLHQHDLYSSHYVPRSSVVRTDEWNIQEGEKKRKKERKRQEFSVTSHVSWSKHYVASLSYQRLSFINATPLQRLTCTSLLSSTSIQIISNNNCSLNLF